MKSKVVDESLSTNATRVLLQRKLLYYFKRQQNEKPTLKCYYEELYFDPNKPYTLFMDALKYACSNILTQGHTTILMVKFKKKNTNTYHLCKWLVPR